jgi:hypothetical protein
VWIVQLETTGLDDTQSSALAPNLRLLSEMHLSSRDHGRHAAGRAIAIA